jgi:hypothetical protein
LPRPPVHLDPPIRSKGTAPAGPPVQRHGRVRYHAGPVTHRLRSGGRPVHAMPDCIMLIWGLWAGRQRRKVRRIRRRRRRRPATREPPLSRGTSDTQAPEGPPAARAAACQTIDWADRTMGWTDRTIEWSRTGWWPEAEARVCPAHTQTGPCPKTRHPPSSPWTILWFDPPATGPRRAAEDGEDQPGRPAFGPTGLCQKARRPVCPKTSGLGADDARWSTTHAHRRARARAPAIARAPSTHARARTARASTHVHTRTRTNARARTHQDRGEDDAQDSALRHGRPCPAESQGRTSFHTGNNVMLHRTNIILHMK